MNVFKTYSIVIVFIFISSLKKLNAPPKDEIKVNKNLEKIRENCTKEISRIFQDDDLLENAKLAFEYFSLKKFKTRCYVSFLNREFKGNVLAYYNKFGDHIQSNNIPSIETFCDEYKNILKHPDVCVNYLTTHYTADKHSALLQMFYKERKFALPSMLSKKIGEGYVDIPYEYFYKVKDTFKINTEEGGMPTPKKFCDELHT